MDTDNFKKAYKYMNKPRYSLNFLVTVLVFIHASFVFDQLHVSYWPWQLPLGAAYLFLLSYFSSATKKL